MQPWTREQSTNARAWVFAILSFSTGIIFLLLAMFGGGDGGS